MTTITELTHKNLKQGQEFFFNNEQHQISIGDDDIRQARVYYDEECPSWAIGFKIEFNGELIHSSKTFGSMKNRLEKLIQDWTLEQSEESY